MKGCKEVVLSWTIFNIKYLNGNKTLKSSVFETNVISWTKWRLWLHQDSLHLHRVDNEGPDTIHVKYRMTVVKSDSNEVIKTQDRQSFEVNEWKRVDLSLDDILADLTEDSTLTINCHMRRYLVKNGIFVRSQTSVATPNAYRLSNVFLFDDLPPLRKRTPKDDSRQPTCETNKQTGSKLQKKERDVSLSISGSYLPFALDSECLRMGVFCRNRVEHLNTVYVKCEMSLLDMGGVPFASGKGSHFFTRRDTDMYQLPHFASKRDVVRHCPEEGLVVHFDNVSVLTTERDKLRVSDLERSCPTYARERCDRRLRRNLTKARPRQDSGCKPIDVPRALLSSRSPVFGTMLTCNMSESVDGVIRMRDLDPQTVERVLEYFYSENVGGLDLDAAKSLYSTADMYQVLGLREECSRLIRAMVTSRNCKRLAQFADLYADKSLKMVLDSFIALMTAICEESTENVEGEAE